MSNHDEDADETGFDDADEPGTDDGEQPDSSASTTEDDEASPTITGEESDESTSMPADNEASTSDESASSSNESASTPGEGEVYCRDCGAVISAKAEICPECGVRQRSPESSLDSLIEVLTNGENPFVAAVYSAILPGLGQFYNREPAKGAAIIVATFIAVFSMLALVGFVLYPAVWLYAVYDAYVVADGRSPPLGGN